MTPAAPAETAMPLLEVRDLAHYYRQPDGSARLALSLNRLSAGRGEALAVVGPSGSGKTTFLHILAALIRPTEGDVAFDGQNLREMGRSGAAWRAASVGYVFQDVNLLPDFGLLENLMIAAEISGLSSGSASERAVSLLGRLGLADKTRNRPCRLSLGERQRAAVARAVLHSPPMVLADEPTASLDADNSRTVMSLLLELCVESQSLLIVATHDESVKKKLPRLVALEKPENTWHRGTPQ
ncbi:MAG: ATP-binding cassette domain-containing protein [Synergistaceae bacterium]|jgi:putative ABC transport system ATP-binding protein|nr:ATP-binding cassette domain-containing protein [Synergistaceae bacterium]